MVWMSEAPPDAVLGEVDPNDAELKPPGERDPTWGNEGAPKPGARGAPATVESGFDGGIIPLGEPPDELGGEGRKLEAG